MSHAVPVSRLSSLGLAVLAILFLLAAVLRAQDPVKLKAGKGPAPTFETEMKPTEVQSLRLQLRQKDALLAKQRLEALQSVIQGAQADYQRALTDLTAEADKVKDENKWGKDTQFDPNKLEFTPAPPPAPKKAEEAKKP